MLLLAPCHISAPSVPPDCQNIIIVGHLRISPMQPLCWCQDCGSCMGMYSSVHQLQSPQENSAQQRCWIIWIVSKGGCHAFCRGQPPQHVKRMNFVNALHLDEVLFASPGDLLHLVLSLLSAVGALTPGCYQILRGPTHVLPPLVHRYFLR